MRYLYNILGPNCELRDSDSCLQKSPKWGSKYYCSGYTRYCDSWSKDLRRCCPLSCGTGRLTENDCNALNGKGTCNYPAESQCPGKLRFKQG